MKSTSPFAFVYFFYLDMIQFYRQSGPCNRLFMEDEAETKLLIYV